MELICSRGKVSAEIGDIFRDSNGHGEWEIVSFGGRTYSPSGIGGTPVVAVKPVGECPRGYEGYVKTDGTIDFCGDSVAASILWQQPK